MTMELNNKCYAILWKTFEEPMTDEMWAGLLPMVGQGMDNPTLASTCVEFMWLRAGRPDREYWRYNSRISYARAIGEHFDALPDCIRLAPPEAGAETGPRGSN